MKDQRYAYSASFSVSANLRYVLPNSIGEATNDVVFGNPQPETVRLCYSNEQMYNLLSNTEVIRHYEKQLLHTLWCNFSDKLENPLMTSTLTFN